MVEFILVSALKDVPLARDPKSFVLSHPRFFLEPDFLVAELSLSAARDYLILVYVYIFIIEFAAWLT